jgi:hypothetical protein
LKLPRALSLTLGTALIIGICYAAAAPVRHHSSTTANSPSGTDQRRIQADLALRCRAVAENLRTDGEDSWAIRVFPPFILAGDLPAERLETVYQETVALTTRALQIDYFDREPEVPITVLMLSTDESYRQALQRFGQSRRGEYAGLYQREERTILLNLSTGVGTLSHELTHALAHADFPQMPEWFDEGLASLHEEAEFSADGLHLLGRDNWRLRFLHEAEDRERWKSLGRLLAEPFAEPDVAALDYALARSLCLFLQERGLLPAFYRKCRGDIDGDTTGETALLRLFPGQSLVEIDREFRAWLHARK